MLTVENEGKHGGKKDNSESEHRRNKSKQPMGVVKRTKRNGQEDERQLNRDETGCALQGHLR